MTLKCTVVKVKQDIIGPFSMEKQIAEILTVITLKKYLY